jgi:hypothetical protein
MFMIIEIRFQVFLHRLHKYQAISIPKQEADNGDNIILMHFYIYFLLGDEKNQKEQNYQKLLVQNIKGC